MSFGSSRKDGSFLEPDLITKVEKQIKKKESKSFKKKTKRVYKYVKRNKKKRWVIKNHSQRNPIGLVELKEIWELMIIHNGMLIFF